MIDWHHYLVWLGFDQPNELQNVPYYHLGTDDLNICFQTLQEFPNWLLTTRFGIIELDEPESPDQLIQLIRAFKIPCPKAEPIRRLAILQESGVQGCEADERAVTKFIPFDDETFGKRYVANLNRQTDLPWYLVQVEMKIVGEKRMITDEDNDREGLERFPAPINDI